MTRDNCIILEFSENELLLCSENVPFARRGWLWVQRVRVPAYTGREIMEYLNKIIREGSWEKVESCHGQRSGLPETLLDSFLQDYISSSMKDNVQPETRQWLVECIMEVAASIKMKCNFQWSDNGQQACSHKVAFLNFDFTYNFTLTKKSNCVFISAVHKHSLQ